MNRIIHFEMTVKDIDRASTFYKQALGWTVSKWEGGSFDYWFVVTGENEAGINGAFVKEENESPKTINTVGVESVDEIIKKIEGAGGKVVTPKTPIQGVGYIAYCQDTEGNTFGLFQDEQNAT